jgi:gamma-glutamylcyclotransferase (GGCT)/AIG2-like uncharacterized protein YtfP
VAVFVYGTLTDRETAAQVMESVEYRGRAELDGLHRADGRYPTLLPGGNVEGRILLPPAIEPLDRYEGVESGLYVRVRIPTADGGHVETYIGDPTRLGVADEWPGSGPFPERVRTYIREHDVLLRFED